MMTDSSLNIPIIEQLDNLSDNLLVDIAQKDIDAFAVLYKRYVRRIYGYLYSRARNSKDAEDLTSQVFHEVLKSLPKYRRQDNFVGWLFKIAQYRAIDHIRKYREDIFLDNFDAFINQENDMIGQIIDSETLEHLKKLIQDLSLERQEMLRLRFAAGLSYREIAVLLNKSEAGIKMALHRLYRELENVWESEDE